MNMDMFVNIAVSASINGAFNSITVFFVYRYFLKHLEKK
jgi:hypothetical protein